jgi:hypothetical protein
MKATVETIREIVKVLTSEEQQLLKDTFLFGAWGDTETEFLNEEGKVENRWRLGVLYQRRSRRWSFRWACGIDDVPLNLQETLHR